MSKPNIVFITRACRSNAGGMERLSFELTQEATRDQAIETAVIAYTGPRVLSPLFNLTCLPRAIRAAVRADVIHLGDPMLSFAGWLIKILLNKPIAVTVHGLDVSYPNPLYQLYLTLFFKKFDAYFPISSYTKRLIKGIAEHHMQVINPGIYDQYYNPAITRSHADKLLNIQTGDKVLLVTTGRLTPRKGHAWFIKNVLPKLPQHCLYVIAGSGQEKVSIIRAAEHANVKNRVMLLGRISHQDLIVLYNSMDAFIQPNVSLPGDTEGFGLVLAEAASCAKAVFASQTEGIPDAIHNGKNGRLLKPQDVGQWKEALQTFIDERQYKNPAPYVLARNYTLQQFSWSHIYPQFLHALLKTAHGRT